MATHGFTKSFYNLASFYFLLVWVWYQTTHIKTKSGILKQKNDIKAGIERIGINLQPPFFSPQVTPLWRASENVVLTWSVTFWSLSIKKKKKYAKSNCIFHWKVRGDRALTFRYLDSFMNKSFLEKYWLLSILDPFRRTQGWIKNENSEHLLWS